MTTQEKMYYIDNMNTERDIRNQIQFAADKGREEGKKEGIEKATLLMASKLKADGMDIELIIKYSGLTREEIEKL
jgi:predicted transposase/invertase (TIGR01784 family)